MDEEAKRIRLKLSSVLAFMNEKQRRILAAAEAKSYGYGGIKLISDITGLCRQTIYRGIADLEEGEATDRIRSQGGGRKRLIDMHSELLLSLNNLIDSSVRGDPESPLRWTCKSIRNIEEGLRELGYEISINQLQIFYMSLNIAYKAIEKHQRAKPIIPTETSSSNILIRRQINIYEKEIR